MFDRNPERWVPSGDAVKKVYLYSWHFGRPERIFPKVNDKSSLASHRDTNGTTFLLAVRELDCISASSHRIRHTSPYIVLSRTSSRFFSPRSHRLERSLSTSRVCPNNRWVVTSAVNLCGWQVITRGQVR